MTTPSQWISAFQDVIRDPNSEHLQEKLMYAKKAILNRMEELRSEQAEGEHPESEHHELRAALLALADIGKSDVRQ